MCKQLESLIGKLSFVSNCVRAGRVFISRLINTLSGFPKIGTHTLPREIRKDIIWWKRFMQHYNGISILWLLDTMHADIVLSTDSSLVVAGAVCGNQYFHVKYPAVTTRKYNNIAHLEMLAIILAVKQWAEVLHGKIMHLSCDNQACVKIVNSGRAKDKKLQECLCELVMIMAKNQSWLKLLSRWYHSNAGNSKQQFKCLTNNKMIRHSILLCMFEFDDL